MEVLFCESSEEILLLQLSLQLCTETKIEKYIDKVISIYKWSPIVYYLSYKIVK